MNPIRIIAALFALIIGFASAGARSYTPDEVPNVHLQDRTRHVSDPDGYLNPADRMRLDSMLDSIRRSTSAEPAIVIVGDMTDNNIDNFATEIFEKWGIGKADKDNGLLIVVAVDPHKVAIRTGYGLEGALPDITCGRIIRNIIAPQFRRGEYGAGLIDATSQIETILAGNTDEIASSEADADFNSDEEDPFTIYLTASFGLGILMLVIMLIALLFMRGKTDYDRYNAFARWKPAFLILTFVGIGLPLIASIPYFLMMHHWRNHKHPCPNCGTDMKKVDEVNDNRYLNPSQDLEEQIGSVDYDVWLCPKCGETDILPYVNPNSNLVECENCHARTARLVMTRIVQQPTATTRGIAYKEYECLNCHHKQRQKIDLGTDNSALAAGAILGSALGSRSSGGFGGGTFGGGFGGGMTGGGGASGGW